MFRLTRIVSLIVWMTSSCCSAFLPSSALEKGPRALRIGKNTDNEIGTFLGNNEPSKPNACLIGYVAPDQKEELTRTLQNVGYNIVSETTSSPLFKYKYIKASGMLKLQNQDSSSTKMDFFENAPKYIPVQSGEENVLVANGWSFLDPDESEPMSGFDVDAANAEGQYKPKWGGEGDTNASKLHISLLGFDLKQMDTNDILSEANDATYIQSNSRSVLLEGGTDLPNVKMTNNGYDFSGSISNFGQTGLFTCAIGGNPLFTTNDLSPLTGSSGWLSFFRAVSDDHITFVHPDKEATDQRIEVLDSKTGCHLGHYFGKQDGYCINASVLNFFPTQTISSSAFGSNNDVKNYWNVASHPISWRLGLNSCGTNDDTISLVQQVLNQNVQSQTILFGAGCFWHVEFALRRIPGVIDTKAGYAGGSFPSPTYEDLCKKDTNHAEVVKVDFDPNIISPRKLIDCFLAMHDPTMVRSHGKRAQGSGQYRSCIFTLDTDIEQVALDAVNDCVKQLGKGLSTEVRTLLSLEGSFWLAEDRHQLHDETFKNKSGKDLETMSEKEWLLEYGRRSSSIFGSSESLQNTMQIDDSGDDGMARMMI